MIEKKNQKGLVSNRRLAKNTIFNLIGQLAPLIVAVFAIPLLIRGLGVDRFGVLTIAWLVIGYFGLFDLGLGWALTKIVAEKLGMRCEEEIPEIVWTALVLMAILGSAGGLIMLILSPWLVHGLLKIPEGLQGESLKSFFLLAACIPVVISTDGLRGILEAHQRFALVTAVRVPMGLFTYLGPLIVLPFSHSLFPVVIVLVIGRLLAWAAHLLLSIKLVPELRHGIKVRRSLMWPLITFGSWMTVSNIIGPIILYFDRFLIGALLSMSAVAYYTTPYEVVTKLWTIPIALVGVLFPALSYVLAQNDTHRVEDIFYRSTKYIFIIMFPVSFLIVAFAHEGLYLWLGSDFSDNSGVIMQILAIGVFINCVARIPSALIQALGRPDLKSKIHMVELPIFIIILYLFVSWFGVVGAAWAFLARLVLDFFAFLMLTAVIYKPVGAKVKWSIRIVIYGTAVILVPFFYHFPLNQKIIFTGLVILAFTGIVWLKMLDKKEKRQILHYARITRLAQEPVSPDDV